MTPHFTHEGFALLAPSGVGYTARFGMPLRGPLRSLYQVLANRHFRPQNLVRGSEKIGATFNKEN